MAKTPAEKQEAFVRLASGRVTGVLNGLRLMENLADRSNYAYTPEQVDALFTVIDERLERTRAAFASEKGSKKEEFVLWVDDSVGAESPSA